MSLNADQELVFNKFKERKSLFITGPGGCGKSYLLEHIRQHCYKSGQTIYTTALTGTAACLIGGQTLHGWSGIGLGTDLTEKIIQTIRSRPPFMKRWREVDVLIIDEISMMSAELFNKLNNIAQALRKNTEFFGGIQMVLSGDFAQLEPIGETKFCFQAAEWQKHIAGNTYVMSTVVRQADPVFQQILNEMRMGIVTVQTREILNKRLIKQRSEADIQIEGTPHIIKATILYPKKRDVHTINQRELQRLKEQGAVTRIFRAEDTLTDRNKIRRSEPSKAHTDLLDKVIERENELCIGAQVMLTKNLDVEAGLVNGSRAVISAFGPEGYPVVIFDNGLEMEIEPVEYEMEQGEHLLVRKQVPFILAWAITIHKSQGASLTEVVTDLSDVFGNGQTYVTLSRVKSLEGLFLLAIDYNKIKCNPLVKKYYSDLNGLNLLKVCPL
jgi:ATP-dependent DNA helicase PIF1